MGVLKWVDWTVSEPRYFQLQTDHTPIHLALLDEVNCCSICTLPIPANINLLFFCYRKILFLGLSCIFLSFMCLDLFLLKLLNLNDHKKRALVCLFPSQISTCHQLLHPQVLQLLVKLFETEHSQLDVMEQVHLFTRTLTPCTACKLPLFKRALKIGKLCVLCVLYVH